VLEKLRVLLIDDDDDTLALVSEILRMYGADVSAVPSVSEALLELARRLPDVIVSDIAMPVEDGYSFIRKVRALQPALGGQVPAIALTAYAGATEAQRALDAGFQVHVAKPVDPVELVALVARLGSTVT